MHKSKLTHKHSPTSRWLLADWLLADFWLTPDFWILASTPDYCFINSDFWLLTCNFWLLTSGIRRLPTEPEDSEFSSSSDCFAFPYLVRFQLTRPTGEGDWFVICYYMLATIQNFIVVVVFILVFLLTTTCYVKSCLVTLYSTVNLLRPTYSREYQKFYPKTYRRVIKNPCEKKKNNSFGGTRTHANNIDYDLDVAP